MSRRPAPSANKTKASKDSQVLTVRVPQELSKHIVERSDDYPHPRRREAPRLNSIRHRNEGLALPQTVKVGGRLSQFVEGWKRITNDPIYPKHCQLGYRRFTTPSTQVPMGNTIRSGTKSRSGNAGTDIPDISSLMCSWYARVRRMASYYRPYKVKRSP